MIGPDLRSSAFQVLSALTVPENRSARGNMAPAADLSTTSGHRPLQPQAFHNHAAAGHFRHRLSMRPHAMYRGRLCSTGDFDLLLLQ